jgi:hypothetical protein
MVGSLLLLSLIRAKFSPIGTLIAMAFAAGFFLCSWLIRLSELCGLGCAGKTGDAIKAEEQQAMAKDSVEMATAHAAAASAGNSH